MTKLTIDLNKVRAYSLGARRSKVNLKDFAGLGRKGLAFKKFYRALPDILAAKDFRYVVEAIVSAYKKRKPVIFMMGAHVIKCGLNPLIIDLIRKKIITCISLNGAGIIHDFELAFCGKTSEDVGEGLNKGSFGMSKETASYLNKAVKYGDKRGQGVGEAVGEIIGKENLKFKHYSILYNCCKLNVPATVHVAIGTDIIHQHPSADGGSIGRASMQDFRKLTEVVGCLGGGGVIVNIGSAVILPEVFLKAVNLARNLGRPVKNFMAVNFDMMYHYRPYQNIVSRPSLGAKAKGCYIVGHHEIMIPLLYQAVLEKI